MYTQKQMHINRLKSLRNLAYKEDTQMDIQYFRLLWRIKHLDIPMFVSIVYN